MTCARAARALPRRAPATPDPSVDTVSSGSGSEDNGQDLFAIRMRWASAEDDKKPLLTCAKVCRTLFHVSFRSPRPQF